MQASNGSGSQIYAELSANLTHIDMPRSKKLFIVQFSKINPFYNCAIVCFLKKIVKILYEQATYYVARIYAELWVTYFCLILGTLFIA